MKKVYSLLLILTTLIILNAYFISALEIKPVKSEFDKGETFIATLSGNILDPIKPDQVEFYRNHVKTSFTYDIVKINDIYYIYALLPFESKDYTLVLKDVYYKENNLFKKNDIELNFTITNKTSEFSINPGFQVTNKNFSVSITNNKDSSISVSYGFENINSSVNIAPSSTRDIIVNTDEFEFTQVKQLAFSSPDQNYVIPVYIVRQSNESSSTNNNSNLPNKNYEIEFSTSKILLEFNKEESFFQTIELINSGNKKINTVSLGVSNSLDKYVFLPQNKIFDLYPGDKAELNFTTNFDEKGNYSGFIVASVSSGEINDSVILNLEFIIGEKNNPVIRNSTISGKNTCSELKGKKCADSQFCSGGSNINSLDGVCCLGECKDFETKTKSNQNWLFAAFAGIIILVIIGILFLKFKKQKSSSSDVLNRKTKSFSERFETRGKVTRE